MSDDYFITTHRVHIVQAVAILVPILGAILAMYIDLRNDVSIALKDDARHEATILEIRKDAKEFAGEMRKAWAEIKDSMAKVEQSAAVSAAIAGSAAKKK